MNIHRLDADDALASLKSMPAGLASTEAERRLREYGRNQIERAVREPLWRRLGREFFQLFSVVLWVAAGLAFLADRIEPGQGMAKLGYVIIAVILVSGLFSFWQEHRAERTLAALRRLLPPRAKVLRDGKTMQLPVERLVPGDIVLLEQGDNVPADARVIETFDLRVNNATVTGESLPQARSADASSATDILQSKNIVLAGTSVAAGQGKAVIFATAMRTEFGKIAHLVQAGGEEASPLRKEIAHVSRVILGLALIIGAVVSALIWWVVGVTFWQAFIFAIGLIVSMVPEGLQATLTLALVLATQRMAKRNVLIRHLSSVETLGSTTVICTDKTGTLTQNRMTAKQLCLGGHARPIGIEKITPPVIERYWPLFLGAQLCQDLRQTEQDGKTIYLGDPTEVALVEMAQRAVGAIGNHRRLDEISFDPERMRASVVCDMPHGATLYCKGAPETLAALSSDVLVDGQLRKLTPALRKRVAAAQEAMAAQGLRVLAFAYRQLEQGWRHESMERNLVFVGLVGLEDPPRPEVAAAIHACREAGIRVIMITGDHPRTAVAIAREIGLIRSPAPSLITGNMLRELTDTQLRLALDAADVVFARVSAEQKLRVVNALKQKQQIVAVTGDGVNDAPALKSAHIGIAMGITGTDVARQAADVVLLDDNFASIVHGVEEGRAVFENIRRFLTYILTHNVAELIPYLAFVLFRIPLPLTPIQILTIDMGTESVSALGLGVERPAPHVMQRPPRARDERLLNRGVALRAYLFLGPIEAGAALAAFLFVLHGGGWRYGEQLAGNDPLYLQATTACLTAIIVMQAVNVYLCRSALRSAFSTGLFGNRLIIAGVVTEIVLILLIGYTPWGNSIVGTAPIDVKVWLFVVPFAVAMFAFEEWRKWIVRRRLGRGLDRNQLSSSANR